MKLTKIVARMDSGAEFCTTYDKPEVTEQNLKDINSEVERCCANGFDFLLTDIGLLCISKIESFYIQTREFDDE
ncbi:hypothetical protein [Limosilactobacillus vaginalis]|uniref:hypothetical protein n=1 Tax=Limosilactobacillus vaginalis TaxID=1633 RepID=UPI002430374B|nr:hypothetical protein [Limosilactobacillus vaginalis]